MNRRRLFAVFAALVFLASVASLFHVELLGPGRSVHLTLAHGALTLRAYRPGEFAISRPGLHLDGFTGHTLRWKPRAAWREQLWIAPLPPNATPGTIVTPASYPIWCSTLIIPMHLPLLALALGGGGWWWMRRRRRISGHCRACAYDRRNLPGPCPECGHDGPAWRTILARAARCILPPACASSTSQPA
ncbi:MAG: hypothetical protein HBSAPP03_07120 [Phycisphaerae bacterium]|nr:MAG: hypothetical protein HBSAPP03_07120 [Phycisphaerae bacterium]